MIPILYQDEQLIAIDKPAWAVVHRMRGARDALVLVNALQEQLEQPIFPVHRLDRQTSGVMVFALSSEVASQLCEDIREQRWQKRYLGLCRGVLHDSQLVTRSVKENEVRRSAETMIHPLEVFCDRYTLLRAEPRTGRRHQIRYHCKYLDHPLAGDVNYGTGVINRFFRETFALKRLFLHASWLRIFKPGTIETLEFSCPLPEELDGVVSGLRKYEGPTV
jgi:tRNA pseudouridine65 synthase